MPDTQPTDYDQPVAYDKRRSTFMLTRQPTVAEQPQQVVTSRARLTRLSRKLVPRLLSDMMKKGGKISGT